MIGSRYFYGAVNPKHNRLHQRKQEGTKHSHPLPYFPFFLPFSPTLLLMSSLPYFPSLLGLLEITFYGITHLTL